MSIELILRKQTCKTGPSYMQFVYLLTLPTFWHCTLLTGYGNSHACTPFLQKDRQIQIFNSFHGTVLLEKLIVSQLVTKFPMFYRTWRFITVFITACKWSLPLARQIQSTPSNPMPLKTTYTLAFQLQLYHGQCNRCLTTKHHQQKGHKYDLY
jgi:hypothetical protein